MENSWKKEQRRLNRSVREKGNNLHSFHANGIAQLPEPILAYLIYHELLKDGRLRNHCVNTEDSYSVIINGDKDTRRSDLWITAVGNGCYNNTSPWLTIEFGKASEKKLRDDLSKIKDALDGAIDKESSEHINVEAGYLILFHGHKKNENSALIDPKDIDKIAKEERLKAEEKDRDSIHLRRITYREDMLMRAENDTIDYQIIHVTK